MIDTKLDLRLRPLPGDFAQMLDGRCPDCGSPLSTDDAGEPACLLCGTWQPPVTAERAGDS